MQDRARACVIGGIDQKLDRLHREFLLDCHANRVRQARVERNGVAAACVYARLVERIRERQVMVGEE